MFADLSDEKARVAFGDLGGDGVGAEGGVGLEWHGQWHTALAEAAETGGHAVVPEAAADGQGHGLLVPNGSFYVEAINGSSRRTEFAREH